MARTKRTTKSNAGREGVTRSARATGQTSDQQPTPTPTKATPGFQPATPPEQVVEEARVERARQEEGAPSAGSTPDEQAGDPAGFEPAEIPEEAARLAHEARGRQEAGHPSGGPTPAEQEAAGPTEPLPDPEPAPLAAIPSAGPTPEDQARDAAEAQSMKDGDAASQSRQVIKRAQKMVDALKDMGARPYVDTQAKIDGDGQLLVLPDGVKV